MAEKKNGMVNLRKYMKTDGIKRELSAATGMLAYPYIRRYMDWIHDKFFGRYALELDIDRQNITVFGSPSDVRELIRREVTTLSSPSGGLMLIYGWYAGTPLENIKALMDALEEYMFYWD